MTVYYQDDFVTLYHGDCRDILPTLGRFDACITDPPYQETALAWDRWPDGWPQTIAAHTSSLWAFGSLRMFTDRVTEFTGWRLSQEIVWAKPGGTGLAVDRFRRAHELAALYYRGRWSDLYHVTPRIPHNGPLESRRHKGRNPPHQGRAAPRPYVDDGTRLALSVINSRNLHGRAIHPTQKPTAVLAPLIEYSVPPGGIVLDPFAGSGSTLAAARALGRRAVGIEINEEYCDRAAQRLANVDLFTSGESA